MHPQSRVSYQWYEFCVASSYQTGVSLHSHASASKESLGFLHTMGTEMELLGSLLRQYDGSSNRRRALPLDFTQAHWRPPVLPRITFDQERQ